MEHQDGTFQSALTEVSGIAQPPQVNNQIIANFRKLRSKQLSVNEFVDGILQQNRTILSKAITLIESSLAQHQSLAQEIIEKCLPYSGNSVRIGITGVPGVGKSSFIETFGMAAIENGKKLAVLAIDPSSEKSKGSILGDKTRMEQLSVHPNAFIRPSPSAGSLGGVARKTRESIILCEAAGFNTIFIETVGVGQSETSVHSMVDFFLLLMLAGAGDELQGIKRGIMEMADAIAITKADGNNITKANLAKAEYQGALHLFPASQSNWVPKVLTCSARQNTGISDIWDTINTYIQQVQSNGYFNYNRTQQLKYLMHQSIKEALHNNFYNNQQIQNSISKIEEEVLLMQKSSFVAANELL